MKEIEILVKINDDIDKVLEIFERFEYIDTQIVIDEYYYDPKRGNLKPDINNSYKLSWDDKYTSLCREQNIEIYKDVTFDKPMPSIMD